MTSCPTVLETDPETGELRDRRDMPSTIVALLRRTHPQVAEVRSPGALRLTSGCIAVVDPIEHLHKQPLARRAPKGEHPVSLHYAARAGEVGAVIVHFGQGDPALVERAAWAWPFEDASRFGVGSGLVALFDYAEVSDLAPPRMNRLSALAAIGADVAGAFVTLPRVRRWNALVCRPAAEGNHYYAAHWARDAGGTPLALVVDFAVFA